MKEFIKTCYKLTTGYHKSYLAMLLFQLVNVFFAVFSTFLIKVIVDTIQGADALNQAVLVERWVIDLLTFGRGDTYLLENRVFLLPIWIVVSGVLTAFASWAQMSLRRYNAAGIYSAMQLTLFHHLQSVPYSYYKKVKSGELIQTCTRDLDVTRKFLIMDVNNFNNSLWLIVFCFSLMMNLSWKLTLVSMALFPVMFIYSFFLVKKVRKKYRLTDDSEARMTDRIQENLGAVRIVKAFNMEKDEILNFETYLTDYKKKFIAWRTLSSFFFSSTDILVFGAKMLALVFGVYLAFMGEINPGTLVVTFLFVNMMVWPLRDTASSLSNMGQYLASVDRIRLIIDEPIEDRYSGKKPVINGNIVFSHVSFHYDDSDTETLHDLSFKVHDGDTVSIIGTTGSGKSTLSLLLTRLYDYTKGSITINGVELKDIQKAYLRKNIVPVLQDPFLFSKSIEANIKMARRDADFSMVKRAAQIASIDDTIDSFKEGYNTQVGEKGLSLSGGQKQRVAIARTLVTESPIVIFDDSLSAVDTETDLKIRENLKRFRGKKTTFLITHRISTAKDSDLIIVLEDGRITEMGKHEDLVNKPGLYKRINDIQRKMA